MKGVNSWTVLSLNPLFVPCRRVSGGSGLEACPGLAVPRQIAARAARTQIPAANECGRVRLEENTPCTKARSDLGVGTPGGVWEMVLVCWGPCLVRL
jgi:hypothetical protein